MITTRLIQAIREGYALSWCGVHGIKHWGRVYTNGLRLAQETGANRDVVKLFAIFHDSMRVNDHIDKGHGARGAELAERFRGKFFNLSDEHFSLLVEACRYHTDSINHDDITVQTCFDADRFDLARVGNMPDSRLLCTNAAKEKNILDWANERSVNGHVPDIVSVWDSQI